MRKKISKEQIIDVYQKFKQYYLKNFSEFNEKKAAHIVEEISDQIKTEHKFDWNDASLSDYINDLIYMVKGEAFARTINKFAKEYFITSICKDFDEHVCKNAKQSLAKHEKYYAEISKTTKKQKSQNETSYIKSTEPKVNKDQIGLFEIRNIVLYGPPGVGKTYSHKKLISMIESGSYSQKELFDQIVQNRPVDAVDTIFENIKNEGRVEFVTFHQSFSYEDFIEGFRPNDEGKIELDDGVFKRLALKAHTNQTNAASEQAGSSFEAAFEKLMEDFDDETGLRVPLKRPGSFYTIYDFNDKTIFFEKQNGSRKHSLALRTLKRIYERESNDLIAGGLASYYDALVKLLQDHAGTLAPVKTELKNFYLVIDEINRGNISKIFGELITLIEEDKRDAIEVTLPYSKESFKVPSNLYIIATMNSTDKSIALIDIALRRRFTFLKMQPDRSLVEPEAREVFERLNVFIAEKLGADFQIGHSYFMNYDDLDFVIDYKIVPLLEEYFFADPDGLAEAKILIGKGAL